VTSILIVDDDPGVRHITGLVLSLEGHEVFVAPDGLEALDVLAHESIDLIVLDLEMPRMDGWTALEEARREGYDGRVIVLSAFGAKAAANQLHADDAVSKPFDPLDLASRVDCLVGGNHAE
jgi:DNA-binding response OmpR family regulator